MRNERNFMQHKISWNSTEYMNNLGAKIASIAEHDKFMQS